MYRATPEEANSRAGSSNAARTGKRRDSANPSCTSQHKKSAI